MIEVIIFIAVAVYVLYKYPIVLVFLGVSVITGIVLGVLKLISDNNSDGAENGFATYTDGNKKELSFFEEPKKKAHNGKCNRDCANCPAHYGYRYGRWYYGHNHVEGCEFGGNRGGGGRD